MLPVQKTEKRKSKLVRLTPDEIDLLLDVIEHEEMSLFLLQQLAADPKEIDRQLFRLDMLRTVLALREISEKN